MPTFNYLLTYAGIPFVLDTARVVRMPGHVPHGEVEDQLPPRDQQVEADLLDEVNRLLDFRYLNDFAVPGDFPGRNVSALARRTPLGPMPTPQIRVGDWYYPHGASRWSVFRGLATSTQVKLMLDATAGRTPQTFVMKAAPCSPDNPQGLATNYTLTTQMYMLPARPLAEHGSQFDGLYLVTLVDERYYWQYAGITLHVTRDTTWSNLIQQLCDEVGVTFLGFTQPDPYYRPEPDSQLWVNQESAALLMDVAAANVGSAWVRNLQGQYNLYQYPYSRQIVNANRGSVTRLVRTAGGDIFQSGGVTKAGNLTAAMNSVLPTHVGVTFPKYVKGDDPVPHFLNPRYANQRPSCWYEESYGDVHFVGVPLLSGGLQFSGQLGVFVSGSLQLDPDGNPFVSSGLTGTSGFYPTVATTAKALYDTEAAAVSGGTPTNDSALASLSMQVASDYFNAQISAALDEVYPGTYAWEPEGIHDVVWTYSSRSRGAFTRVLRTQWNREAVEMQHSPTPAAGETNVPRGVGGPSVPQTWRDRVSGTVATTLRQTLNSGDFTAFLNEVSYFPTDGRWRGRVGTEVILFEGTSGGRDVGVVYRGIDGTVQEEHANGSAVTQVLPNVVYGANLVTHGPMQWSYPRAWTSGGVQEIGVVPQTQTVRCLADAGVTFGGVRHFSGVVNHYRTDVEPPYVTQEYVWLVDRNDESLKAGNKLGGQFVGYSASGVGGVAPVYLVDKWVGSGDIFASGSVYNIHYNIWNIFNNTHNYYDTDIFYNSGTVVNINNSYINFVYYTVNNFPGGVYDPGNNPKIRFVLAGTVEIAGFLGGVAGRLLFVWNAGAGTIRLLNGAAGVNSIRVPLSYATYYDIPPDEGVILQYDADSGVWRFDHPNFGTGPVQSTPDLYATRWLRFGNGMKYSVFDRTQAVADVSTDLTVKNLSNTSQVTEVSTIVFDDQNAGFVVTVDGTTLTAFVSQTGFTGSKTVVTDVTCVDGVLAVTKETWTFQRGRLVLVT